MAEIRWFGHNCFRIRGKEATILTDPLGGKTGFPMSRQTADIVTISHHHPGHANVDIVKPPFKTLDGPGEYEVSGVFVTGIRTAHDNEKGAANGFNTVYVMELEGISFCHLGDLGHLLDDEQVESLEGVDVLMAPAGGFPLEAAKAAEVVAQIAPKVVIPMQYRAGNGDAGRGDVADFVKQLGVDVESTDKLTLKSSEIGETMRVVLLEPSS